MHSEIVLAVVGFAGPTMDIVAIGTHALSVMLFVGMRAIRNLLHLLCLENFIHGSAVESVDGLVHRLEGAKLSLPKSADHRVSSKISEA